MNKEQNTAKTVQEIQDEIFKKMRVKMKIKLASALTILCLKLNRLNERTNPGKTSR